MFPNVNCIQITIEAKKSSAWMMTTFHVCQYIMKQKRWTDDGSSKHIKKSHSSGQHNLFNFFYFFIFYTWTLLRHFPQYKVSKTARKRENQQMSVKWKFLLNTTMRWDNWQQILYFSYKFKLTAIKIMTLKKFFVLFIGNGS